MKILFIVLFLFPAFASEAQVLFDPDKLKERLEVLADDSLEGRGTGSEGSQKAAGYIARQMEQAGVKPGALNDSWFQQIPMHGSMPLDNSDLIIYTSSGEKKLKLGEDYLLYKSGEQTFTPSPREMYFAGYGITAPEYDYNDYHEADVSSKIIVMLEGEPVSSSGNYFAGEIPTIYSYAEAKQRIAISRGAAGSVIIPDTNSAGGNYWERMRREFAFEDVTLAYTVTSNLSLLINPGAAGAIFEGTERDIEDIYEMSLDGKMKSFPLKAKLSFRGDFRRRDFLGSNVIGIVEGNDPELKDTYVIVSAHYDHLGIGPAVRGDSVYNGALDNAIGTAAVISLAEAFVKPEHAPQRSIIFILTTGEEKGLLGSQFYVDHPVKPLYKTVANINVDGIAFIDNFKSIIGAGMEYSTLENHIRETAEEAGLFIANIPSEFMAWESFNRSDQMAFAKAGIPAALIMEGPDFENISGEEGISRMIDYQRERYHTPFDDLTQEINYSAAVQHVELLFNLIKKIADSPEEPEWNKDAPFNNARLRSRAGKF